MDEPVVNYTLKELFGRLEQKLDGIESKLDKELEHIDSRITSLETFRARFLPTSIVVALLMAIGIVVDLFIRLTA